MTCRVKLVLQVLREADLPVCIKTYILNYLGSASNLSQSGACRYGSIWTSRCISATDRTPWRSLKNVLRSDEQYYRWQFSESMDVATRREYLVVLEWLPAVAQYLKRLLRKQLDKGT
ncbi:hypothetical protein GN958_ATG00246 [Phytophthora infestans]|uniref:Uncharacterized protein n=1 Tax=Phytophthora infestans TaxID=4787 RepID=A0A8S9VGF3_PHYIN|nr:hypothetical protein GN958_ATG00246 [Phytophthora infestans]